MSHFKNNWGEFDTQNMGLKSSFIFNDKLKNQCFYQKISSVDQLIDVVYQVALHSVL